MIAAISLALKTPFAVDLLFTINLGCPVHWKPLSRPIPVAKIFVYFLMVIIRFHVRIERCFICQISHRLVNDQIFLTIDRHHWSCERSNLLTVLLWITPGNSNLAAIMTAFLMELLFDALLPRQVNVVDRVIFCLLSIQLLIYEYRRNLLLTVGSFIRVSNDCLF